MNYRRRNAGHVSRLENFFAAPIAVVEARLAEKFPTASGGAGSAASLALVTLVVFVTLIVVAALGREKRGIEF